MPKQSLPCPKCGESIKIWRNPVPTVDIIIEVEQQVVLIERANPPYGWALPGGFVDYGESLEAAAVREAQEETNLKISNLAQFAAYSDPQRDPRQHTISVVFTATADSAPVAGDDAAKAELFHLDRLPEPICFDHPRILADYRALRVNGAGPRLVPFL